MTILQKPFIRDRCIDIYMELIKGKIKEPRFYLNQSGDWYIIADTKSPTFKKRKTYSVGFVTREKLTTNFLRYHAENCIRCNIPMYIGKDEEVKEICDSIYKIVSKELCQQKTQKH